MDRHLRVGGLHRAVIGREQQQRDVHQQQGQRKGEKDLRHVAERQDPADQEVLQQHADHEQDRHRDGKRHQRIDPEARREEEADVHADHHEFALGEVDDLHDAEDQRDADAHQRIDSADQQAVNDGLCYCREHRCRDRV